MIMRVYNSNALRCVVCGDGKDYHAKNFSRMMKVLLINSKLKLHPQPILLSPSKLELVSSIYVKKKEEKYVPLTATVLMIIQWVN